VTVKEQYIYNCYLEVSRKLNSQPFRYRKNFDNFEEKEEYIYITKLAYFFSKFENINIKDFFEAPYFVYNEKYFDLKYFTSQKAIKAYTIYQTKFLPENPDHSQTLEKIKNSFVYIFNFCKTNGVKLEDYLKFKQPNSQWHEFMLHVKNREVIIYPLFMFPNFDKTIQQYDNDIREFVFGDIFTRLNFYRTKYHVSEKAKKLCILIFDKLKNKTTTL
jgi:hypothetical protein